jgi:hypothetical protein
MTVLQEVMAVGFSRQITSGSLKLHLDFII